MGIEFNSLSKTYNLTGLRISFALGNADVIKHFKTIRSQFDYGTSYIVQKAAVAALNGPQDGVVKQQAQYQSRRDALCDGLNAIGWKVPYSEGTMFVWLRFQSSLRILMNSVYRCLKIQVLYVHREVHSEVWARIM